MRRGRFLFVVAFVFVSRIGWAQGNPLGPEFRVNTYTTGAQSSPSVAFDSTGSFVVVWNSSTQDGSSGGVFGQRYDSSGVPLGPEFRVNSYTTDGQQGPSVASDASGNFVVVWYSYGQDGSTWGVFAQRYASSGEPLGSEFRVNTYTTRDQFTSSIASDPSGNVVVVWTSGGPPPGGQDGDLDGVFAQRYASSGAPQGPEFRVNTYTTNIQHHPSVAADASGNFVVVWQSDWQDGYGYGVFGQRHASSGAPLGPEFRVNTSTTGHQVEPKVATDSAGNFVVVWLSADPGGVFGQRYSSSGVPLGPEFRISTYTTTNQQGPSVGSDASGNFVVVWQSYTQDGSTWGVFGQRYSSSGAPLGPEFRVNTYTTGDQENPSVASDPSGNFIVVWQSDAQDGSGLGVFGQRYSEIVPVELMRFGVE